MLGETPHIFALAEHDEATVLHPFRAIPRVHTEVRAEIVDTNCGLAI